MFALFLLQAEELFLWIPRKMLMTVESAKNSVLGESSRQGRPDRSWNSESRVRTELSATSTLDFLLIMKNYRGGAELFLRSFCF